MNRKIKSILMGSLVAVLCACTDGKTISSTPIEGTSSIPSDLSSTALSITPNPLSSTVTSSSVTPPPSSTTVNPDVGAAQKMVIHFRNATEKYDNLCFWIWSSSVKLEEETPALGTDDFGLYTEIELAKYVTAGETSVYFLVKSIGDWTYKTADIEMPFAKFDTTLVDGIPTMNVYALAISKSEIELSKTPDAGNREYIKSVSFDKNMKTLHVEATGEMSECKVYGFNRDYYIDVANGLEDINTLPYLISYVSAVNAAKKDIQLGSTFTFDFNTIYTVEARFTADNGYKSKRTADISNLYSTTAFQNKKYDGNDLGVTFAADGTPVFKVFAPTAAFVRVNIYKYGYPSSLAPTAVPAADKPLYDAPLYTIDLKSETGGVHSSADVTTGDWGDAEIRKAVSEGTFYYTYEAYTSKGTHEVVDPYARSTSVNSLRALICHLDSEEAMPAAFAALPKVWHKDPVFDIESPLDLVISENHIRDLTMDETWTSDPTLRELAGTYKGFALEGTTYTKNGVTVKTGADHLEEYGVNALQLLPIFDQDNDDLKKAFNWGYNPLNYNVPEGSYSTDPYDGYKRIYELREMIAKYANNANHTRIIMDVVYNHVSKAENSNFEYLAPGYYFRLDKNGEYLDNSGCGNEFKSEAYMARKFIVDSVCYWAKEYLIKGFRFDLMGLIDVETMKQVKESLHAIDPDIVVYGEGWDATGAYSGNSKFANTSQVYSSLYSSDTSKGYIGAFNDAGRDSIRGGNNGGGGLSRIRLYFAGF